MSRLSMCLLGAPQIKIDGEAIQIKRRKAVALLLYLAVTQQRHTRDALAAMFWPEADQSRARASLRSALWALNKTALEEWLLVEQETVALRPLPGVESAATGARSAPDIDVLRFRDLLAASQRHDHTVDAACPHCLDLFTEAVSLYEDDFLAGFTLPDAPAFDEWHFFQADTLRRELATALLPLVDLHSAQGDFTNAISYARRLVALDPLHEPAQRTLMREYARAGQQSAALRQYEICRQLLDSELGLESAEANFPDGIYFVSLTPLSDPEAIIPAIAEATGYPFQADKRPPRQQLFAYLRHKSILLLLDNVEHLLRADQPDGATFVADLLQKASHLKLLTTSREPLNLYEEQRYPLHGLEIAEETAGDPRTESTAATLFLQTARRPQPDFQVAAADSPYLAEICRLVEGMPLALELAASWIDILSLSPGYRKINVCPPARRHRDPGATVNGRAQKTDPSPRPTAYLAGSLQHTPGPT